MIKNLPAVQKTWVWSLGQEDPLEKGMTTHYGILAWEIPWTEEYWGLQSMGLQRVGLDWVADTFTFSAPFTTDALWDLWKWKLYYVSPQYSSTQHNSHLEESLSISALGIQFSSVQLLSLVQSLSRVWLFASMQHARPSCPSRTSGVHPNPCPLSWWCHPTISSSVILSSFCPQSFPASGYFHMSQLFASGFGY